MHKKDNHRGKDCDNDDNHRVNSALISVNGHPILGPKDFNQERYVIEVPVSLKENNSISVDLRSKPGSYLSVEIIENIEGGYIKPFDPENVILDPYTGLQLIQDQIIVLLKETASQDSLTRILASVNGVIVGYLQFCNIYQIELKPSPTIDQLWEIIYQLKNDPDIQVVNIHTVSKLAGILSPNDPQWNIPSDDFWDESSPAGKNWGLEVIYARYAWADAWPQWPHTTANPPAKIGIVDGGFMIDHEDINLSADHAVAENGQILSGYSEFDDHGTHVLGVIGAEADNGVGITGIMWKKDLYVYRVDDNGLAVYRGIEKLLQKAQGLNVINISLESTGWGGNCLLGIGCPSDNNPHDLNWLAAEKSIATTIMSKLEEEYGDFLIVQAAGNYNIDAKWVGYFASIDDQTLKKKILIVANIKHPTGCPTNCSYDLSIDSNWGSQVDIAAPGQSIFSTISHSPYYGLLSGTSMAAPHVTGVAGLVWSVNDKLTASQVKEILVNTSKDRTVTDNEGRPYGILNAKAALQPRPVIISSLEVLPAGPYLVGNTIAVGFKIENRGSAPITLDVLTVGGRDPNGQVSDFPWDRNVVLEPFSPKQYSNVLTLSKVGTYHFFTAYRTLDGQWNTSIPTEIGVTNTLDITVSAPAPVLTSIVVTPASAPVAVGATQQFAATAFDQFNNPIVPQPSFSWTSSNASIGTVNGAGLFTALSAGGPISVTASVGPVIGSASVTVSSAPNQIPIAGFTISALGQTINENGVLNLSVPQGQTASVTFSASRSSDPDGSIMSYQWYINGTPVNTARDFNFGLGAGTHQILLEVWDNLGSKGAVGATILISQVVQPPQVENWCVRNSGTFNQLFGVAYGNGTYVAVGLGDESLTSPDGLTWTAHPLGASYALMGLAFGNNIFVAIGANNKILTSNNGVTWLEQVLSGQFIQFNRVTYKNGKFIVVGMAGTILTSTDGMNWNSQSIGTGNLSLWGVTYDNGKYVAVGGDVVNNSSVGTTVTSSDALTWSIQNPGTSQLMDVTYGNGKFVAVGWYGTILTSTDGMTWIPSNSGTTAHLRGIAFGGNYFVAVGQDGTILVSNDGMTWQPIGSGTLDYITSVAYVNNTFLSATKSGAVISPDSNCNPLTLRINGCVASSAPQGSVFSVTGSNFTPYGPVTLHLILPAGNENILPIIYSDSNGNISWTSPSSCSNLPGVYEIWAIDNQTGKSSNSVGEILMSSPVCPQPTLLIDGGTSRARQQGETFSFTGMNYTPNGIVTRHFQRPDGGEEPTQTIQADGNGNISWTWTPTCSSTATTYTIWAADDATGMTSNTVSEIITANPSCSNTQPVPGITMTAQGQTVYENQTLLLPVSQGQVVEVTFSSSRSYDPDGSITAYQWYINGTPVSTVKDFNFGLGEGTHYIYLEVWDNSGNKAAVGATVIVTSVSYQGHFAYTGWGSWYSNGATCGTPGGNQMEAIIITVGNYVIQYRAHVAYDGWLPWVSNGQVAGTTEQGKSLQAIEIQLVTPPPNLHISYRVYVQDTGWQDWVSDGATAGTTGLGKAVQAIEIQLQTW
jgi:uncharacterized protein YjdB